MSFIDPTKPEHGDPSTQSVRDNFAAAKLEIEALQAAMDALLPSDALPAMDGAASAGVAAFFSRGDHVHPVDTSRYPASNPAGFVTGLGAAAAAPVQTVAGRTGAIVLKH